MKKLIAIFLLLSILLLGCSQGTSYNQPANPPQNSQGAVGGGCNVAPASSNNDFGDLMNVEIKEGF